MDFEYFHNLSAGEAKDFLSDFLRVGARRFPEFAEVRLQGGILCDFSIPSIAPVMTSLLPKMVRILLEPDLSVPPWIRDTDSYRNDHFDFDSASKELIVTTSYYLGECFIRSFPSLRWATGKHGMAQMNMPVVTGFTHEKEMAVMMVAENIFAAALANPAEKAEIEKTVNFWTEFVSTNTPSMRKRDRTARSKE